MTHLNSIAEEYISKILEKAAPYTKRILGIEFIISDSKVYPPGKLTEMFASYLIKENLIKGKFIADIGAGCFALGIIAALKGARKVIGVDISLPAVECARINIMHHNLTDKVNIYESDGIFALLPKYQGKIDIIVAGVPWDNISALEFEQISDARKSMSRAFYDVDDKLITDILIKAPLLLTKTGKIFITSAQNSLNRIVQLCTNYSFEYKIVKAEDIHKDGNIHYILSLYQNLTKKSRSCPIFF